MIAYYLIYDVTGKSGSGGYSRGAKHKPQPRVVRFDGDITFSGKSLILGGNLRKLKATIFDDTQVPAKLIRFDYDLADLRKLGADLPKTYQDSRDNIRDGATGAIIFRAPQEEPA